MGGCRCTYKNCERGTKNSDKDFHFYHYPVRDVERCKKWIENARKPAFHDLPDDQLRNKVVCQLHFEPHYFTNTTKKRLIHNAIPTIDAGSEEPMNSEINLQVLQSDPNGSVYKVDTDNFMQTDSRDVKSYILKNGDIIPADAAESDGSGPVSFSMYTPRTLTISSIKSSVRISEQREKISIGSRSLNGNIQLVSVKPDVLKNKLENVSAKPQILNKELISIEKIERCNEALGGTLYQCEDKNEHKINANSGQTEVICVTEISDIAEDSQLDKHLDGKLQQTVILPEKLAISKVSENDEVPVIIVDDQVNHMQETRKSPSEVEVRNITKTIEQHGKDIACLKRIINMKMKKRRKRFSNLQLMRRLRGSIPSTLYGALSLHLLKKTTNFSRDERDFLVSFYRASPVAYETFMKDCKWNLPDSNVAKQLLGS